uniref:G_PROTEIN_RECEP_F1_2 domain-containing protein n=2 Tax=Rhabditophanes sp. KR3021 TaxID=114890 RepID=A0AC35TLE3_9BILA
MFGLYSEIFNIFQGINIFSMYFFGFDKVLSYIYELISICGGMGFTVLSLLLLVERSNAYKEAKSYDKSGFDSRYIIYSIICLIFASLTALNLSAQFVHYAFSLLAWSGSTLISTIGLMILYVKNEKSLRKERALKRNINKRYQLRENRESVRILVFMNIPLAITSLGAFVILFFIRGNIFNSSLTSSIVFITVSIFEVIYPLVMILKLKSTKKAIRAIIKRDNHVVSDRRSNGGVDRQVRIRNDTESYFEQAANAWN